SQDLSRTISSPSARSRLGGGWPRDHALSLAYFSKTSRLSSARTALREICPFRSLAIFKRSGSVGARDFRSNLAKNLVAGPAVLPNRLPNNPIVTSLVRDMFREPLYRAFGADGPQHHGISRDGCRRIAAFQLRQPHKPTPHALAKTKEELREMPAQAVRNAQPETNCIRPRRVAASVTALGAR